jgi:hypothetical protein
MIIEWFKIILVLNSTPFSVSSAPDSKDFYFIFFYSIFALREIIYNIIINHYKSLNIVS